LAAIGHSGEHGIWLLLLLQQYCITFRSARLEAQLKELKDMMEEKGEKTWYGQA